MKEFIKRNFAILLAFILPALLIIIVAVTTYLPSLFVSTHYNFIYTTCADGTNYYPYNCNGYLQQVYSVVNGKLVKNNVDLTQDFNKDGVPDFSEAYNARVFFHDTKKNESREITFTEAQALTLNNLLTSPYGVTVSSSSDNRGGDFFFPFGGYSSSYGYSLTKGKNHRKLNLINGTDRYYYQNNFQFIGWVLPGRQ